jgi:hypothetical protein
MRSIYTKPYSKRLAGETESFGGKATCTFMPHCTRHGMISAHKPPLSSLLNYHFVGKSVFKRGKT